MKNLNFSKFLALLLTGVFLVTSCKDDDSVDPIPEYGSPTISITSPVIPAEGFATEVGSTVSFTLEVGAEAGLSTLSLGENVIKTYAGTETSSTEVYDYLALEAGTVTLSFVVEDASGKLANIDALLIVEEGVDLGYLLIDFAGDVTATEDKTVVDWDIRKLSTFGVSGSHGTSATAEAVNQQAQLSFAQTNPDAEDNAKVMKIEKIVTEGRDNWGGWAHVIFNLGSVISEDMITALPKWENETTVAGTKVIMLDAYYDATVDAAFTWDSVISRDVWNADPTLGYKVDLCIATYDPMGVAENGHDGAFYMGYSAYVGEPNKWITLTFNVIDEGRTGSMYGISADSPEPDAIDCVKIMPSPGYSDADGNPFYIKNLRIVDVE